MAFAQPQDVAKAAPRDLKDEHQLTARDQALRKASSNQGSARHLKSLAALRLSQDDYLEFEQPSAGNWLLQTAEYQGFKKLPNSVLQLYGLRSSTSLS